MEGFGSKKKLLETFVAEELEGLPVIVINGYDPERPAVWQALQLIFSSARVQEMLLISF